jgi:hypothetical protein
VTKLLSIDASPEALIACDMRGASDTLVQRLAEYRRLFDHALVERHATPTTTTFRFTARPGVAEWVRDLVTREAACCPFLSYEVVTDGEQIVWTTTGLGTSDLAVIEEFIKASAGSDDSVAIAGQLTVRGGVPVIVPTAAS